MNYRVLHAQGKRVEEQEIVIEKMPAWGGWQCAKMKPWEISATLLQGKLMLALAAEVSGLHQRQGHRRHRGHGLRWRAADAHAHGGAGQDRMEGQGGAGYRVKR